MRSLLNPDEIYSSTKYIKDDSTINYMIIYRKKKFFGVNTYGLLTDEDYADYLKQNIDNKWWLLKQNSNYKLRYSPFKLPIFLKNKKEFATCGFTTSGMNNRNSLNYKQFLHGSETFNIIKKKNKKYPAFYDLITNSITFQSKPCLYDYKATSVPRS